MSERHNEKENRIIELNVVELKKLDEDLELGSVNGIFIDFLPAVVRRQIFFLFNFIFALKLLLFALKVSVDDDDLIGTMPKDKLWCVNKTIYSYSASNISPKI